MIQMRKMFDLYDHNGSGQLEFRELRQVLAKLGLPSESSTVLVRMGNSGSSAVVVVLVVVLVVVVLVVVVVVVVVGGGGG